MRFARIFPLLLLKARLCSLNSRSEAMTSLKDLGYAFNQDGVMKKIDKDTGKITDEGFIFNAYDDHLKNQRRYEEIGEAVTGEVYKLMDEQLHKIYVPGDIPQSEATFIYSSKPNLKNCKKLLILIHGSGVVRAGQWTRSLIINHSVNHGTQLPYINQARDLGYDVIVTNPNDNYRNHNLILGHSTPVEHASSVWEKYVMEANPESVAIVAHSYGGVVTIELAHKYKEFFKQKVFAVGLTDSVHTMFKNRDREVINLLASVGRNWVTSTKPLNTEINSSGDDIPRYSAGHTKHEWTSYSCMTALFGFFEQKYSDFIKDRDVHAEKNEL